MCKKELKNMSSIVLLSWLTSFIFNLFNVVCPHKYIVHNAPNAAYPQQNYNMNPAGVHPNGGQAPIINNYYGTPGVQSVGGGGGGGSGPSLLVRYRIRKLWFNSALLIKKLIAFVYRKLIILFLHLCMFCRAQLWQLVLEV